MSARPRSAARPLLLAALAAALLAPAASAKRPEPVLVLGGRDPVALAEGREAQGREDVTADHGRYRYRYEERWGEKPYGHALDGEAAMDVSGGYELPAEPAVRDHIVRDYWRHPIALVRERRSARMVVRWAGRDTVAGAPAEVVETAIGGATTSLAIDPATGRVLQARFRGRTSNGHAPMTHSYGDFRPAGGIAWPFAVEVGYDGAPLRSPRLAVTGVHPDPEVDAARFRPAN